MDLLSVVMHELGHVLGYEDVEGEDPDLMSEPLEAGVRQLPDDYIDVDWVAVDSVDEMNGLVSMDSDLDRPEAAVAPEGSAKGRKTWLADFLTRGTNTDYNPFEPNEDIRIVLDDEEDNR